MFTSNWISRPLLPGAAKGGIEKMRSIFFQRTKSSGVPAMQPAGWRGKSNELKKAVCNK